MIRYWAGLCLGYQLMAVDVLTTHPYASCNFRESLSISLKDIGNYRLNQVQTALKHINDMVSRWETAATQAQAKIPSGEEGAASEHKLTDLAKRNERLKESANLMVGRLDAAIARLAAALKD